MWYVTFSTLDQAWHLHTFGGCIYASCTSQEQAIAAMLATTITPERYEKRLQWMAVSHRKITEAAFQRNRQAEQ